MAAASFVRRTAAFRSTLRPSISRTFPAQPRSQLPHLPPPSPSSTSRYLSRKSPALLTLLPFHSAIASSRLVSNIPSDPCACVESILVSFVEPMRAPYTLVGNLNSRSFYRVSVMSLMEHWITEDITKWKLLQGYNLHSPYIYVFTLRSCLEYFQQEYQVIVIRNVKIKLEVRKVPSS